MSVRPCYFALVRGFTLVELLFVVAVIGILVALALPAYQNYATRSRLSEVVMSIAGHQKSIAEKIQTDSTLSSAGVGFSISSSGFVDGGLISTAGVIVLSIKSSIGTAGLILSFTPTLNGGVVAWSCNSNMSAIVPASCRS